MRRALLERPVSGTTASVNRIDYSSITIKVKNIDGISTYHNIEFEDTGIRVWKAFGIGEDVGKHGNTVQSESLYDQLRRDWAEKFLTIDCRKKSKNAGVVESMGAVSSDQNACENRMVWALSKSRAGSIRFSQNVRDYLTERFDLGEITGMKSNPSDVENDMRSARNERMAGTKSVSLETSG
ncbi:Hypothetical predicted protein [Paramuricea clavata]|uniref:Uncharacterized protein n=1 Tax=Paramuricea clavata TaxID=317549 RepID=A0A6S7KDM6_PARCT|nr:Hypothetical predicted protein [Paramuricea clavata]